MVGLGLDVVVLDIVRIGLITIVALRKFEVRKKQKEGFFAVRKVNKKQLLAEKPVPFGDPLLTKHHVGEDGPQPRPLAYPFKPSAAPRIMPPVDEKQ